MRAMVAATYNLAIAHLLKDLLVAPLAGRLGDVGLTSI